MSQSMYLTIYLRNNFNEQSFRKDMDDARRVFRILWEIEGTGFDEKGNIKGLAELYNRMGYHGDSEDLENENGALSILKMSKPYGSENISFNFHNYGAELNITEETELRDIYKLFAEILSSCFGYVVKLSDSYDEPKYSLFFDEDGKQYYLKDDRAEYIQAVKEMDDSQKKIKIEEETLSRAKEILKKYKENEESKNSNEGAH